MTAYDTDIEDFQAQVTNASVGVLRGYLANAERVRVRGVELDSTALANFIEHRDLLSADLQRSLPAPPSPAPSGPPGPPNK